MNDRKNLPSASGIERVALCPGSWNLERGQPDTSSPEAASGTRIHSALAGEVVSLDPDEQDLAESIKELEIKVRDEWVVEGAPIMTKREKRMWLMQDDQEIFSGQPDVVFIQGSRACCLDYKTGRAEQSESASNYQLTALAVLIGENEAITEVTCGIIQPRVTHKVELCVFDRAAIDAAADGIIGVLAEAQKSDAPLVPGDKQCRWCRAKLVCPALKLEVAALAVTTIHEPSLVVTNDELASLLDKCGRVMKLVSEIGAEARRRIEAGQVIPGFELVTGKGKRKVNDVSTVAERLNNAGASWSDIAAASSITIGAVKDLARSASKLKGMALTKFVNDVLDGATSTGEAKPRLQRVGAALEEGDEES